MLHVAAELAGQSPRIVRAVCSGSESVVETTVMCRAVNVIGHVRVCVPMLHGDGVKSESLRFASFYRRQDSLAGF